MAISTVQRRWLLIGVVVAFAVLIGLMAPWRLSPPPSANHETASAPGASSPVDARHAAPASAAAVSESKAGASNRDWVDFRAAADTALKISDPGQRAREFGRLLLLWLARDLEGALAYVRQ